MAANAQLWMRVCEIDRRLEIRRIRHQRRRSYAARLMTFNDGPVHAAGEAKIVSIDDETAHGRSLHDASLLFSQDVGTRCRPQEKPRAEARCSSGGGCELT